MRGSHRRCKHSCAGKTKSVTNSDALQTQLHCKHSRTINPNKLHIQAHCDTIVLKNTVTLQTQVHGKTKLDYKHIWTADKDALQTQLCYKKQLHCKHSCNLNTVVLQTLLHSTDITANTVAPHTQLPCKHKHITNVTLQMHCKHSSIVNTVTLLTQLQCKQSWNTAGVLKVIIFEEQQQCYSLR